MTPTMPGEMLPCPFCSTPIRRVISKARSFNPPRDYIEWHHDTPAVNCYLYNVAGRVMATTADNTQAEADFIAAWNRRPQPIAGDGWNEAELMLLAEVWASMADAYGYGEPGAERRMKEAKAAFAAALRRPAQPAQGDVVERMRDALTQAEACMSIVEPRSDKAEYLRILGVIRAALSAMADHA